MAGAPAKEYGVYHFRKSINLATQPASFLVHVSGDNRYKLLVNGQQVCFGPARSDMYHWNFETVDLAPFLKAGNNILAAVVWNYGDHMPVAQMSYRTGFILQGNGPAERVVDTNKSWKGIRNPAYTPLNTPLYTYFVIGPGENIDGTQYPWGWETAGFDDKSWPEAAVLSPGLVGGVFEPWFEAWHLQPRTIPAMEVKAQRLASTRQAIDQIRNSHGLSGITMSRYPSNLPQYIPTFSLWWIGMVNDYWKYRGDEAFVKAQLPVARSVINFFESKQKPDGAMGSVPYWTFTDWAEAPGWKAGIAPRLDNGSSAALDLQLLLAYQAAMPLETAVGLPAIAQHYNQQISALKQTVKNLYRLPMVIRCWFILIY